MGKFIQSTLSCMMWLVASMVMGSIVYAIVNFVIISNVASDETTKNMLSIIIIVVSVGIFCYITMHRSGYRKIINDYYGNKSLKEVVIPIIIAVLAVNTIHFLMILPSEDSMYANRQDVLKSGLPQVILDSILWVPFMILGYRSGCKKYEKEKKEMLVNKKD